MATGVELPQVDVEGWVREQAEAERALLALAQQEHPKGDDRGHLAATELLSMYVERDPFHAPDVLAAIQRGARMMARKVLNEGRPNISPENYFGKDGEDGRRKDPINLARLQLRKDIGLHLSATDARKALTKEKKEKGRGKKPVDKQDWPDTIGEVETAIVAYVLMRFRNKAPAASEAGEVGKADRLRVASKTELELARDYVRDSFAWLPWNNPEAPVTYPASW